MAHLLGAESVHLAYPTKKVLDSVTVGISEGDRIGVVGRNGDGKSSLLSVLAGRITPDSGRVTHRSGMHIGMLQQEDSLDPDLTVQQIVVGEGPEHVWASDPKIRNVFSGLLADIDVDAKAGTLSGGQRRRVALAALLVGSDDVLFLDEPTNHLDIEAITWLARHLTSRWPATAGGLVVITHDRWFLDEISTTTWEVHNGAVTTFEGGYAAYVLRRVERERAAAVAEAKRHNLMRKELAWLRRGAPARTSKPKFRIEAANQLIAAEPPPRDSVELVQLATSRLGKDVVEMTNVSVAFGDNTVLSDLTWLVGPGDRFGILGVNGAGKSTLLSVITGDLTPTTGRVKRGKTVKFASLSQQLTELDEVAEDRVSNVIARYRTSYQAGAKEMTPGQLLEQLGFTNAHVATKVKDLSGGQKRRLQLLMILLDEPNVLILDEPSNDLDTDMLAAMEDLLDTWPGTLLVVSHDRYLMERVTDHQYGLIDGNLRHLPGGVDEYLTLVENPAAAATGTAHGSALQGPSPDKTTGAENYAAKKELAALERKISKTTGLIADLHTMMSDHDPLDYEGLTALNVHLHQLNTELDQLELQWFDIAERTE